MQCKVDQDRRSDMGSSTARSSLACSNHVMVKDACPVFD